MRPKVFVSALVVAAACGGSPSSQAPKIDGHAGDLADAAASPADVSLAADSPVLGDDVSSADVAPAPTTLDGPRAGDVAPESIDAALAQDSGRDVQAARPETRDVQMPDVPPLTGLDGGDAGSSTVYATSDLLMGGMIKVGEKFYHYGTKGARNRLFIRKSTDLKTWSPSYYLLSDLVTKLNAGFGTGWVGFERLKIIPRQDDNSFVLFVKVTGNNVGKSMIISVRFKSIDAPVYVEPAIKQLLPNEGDIDVEVTPTGAAFFIVASYNMLNQYGVFKLWNLTKPDLSALDPGTVKDYSEGPTYPRPYGIYGSHDYPREAPSLTWDPLHKQWLFLESSVNGWKPTPNYWVTANDDSGLHPEKVLLTLPAPATNLLGDSTNHYSQTTYLFHDQKDGEDYWIYMVDRYTADPAGGGNWFQMWFPAVVTPGKVEILWGS